MDRKQVTEDINMDIAMELFDKVREIVTDYQHNSQESEKEPAKEEVKIEPKPKEVKKTAPAKDFYHLIENILMTGSNKLDPDILENILKGCKSLDAPIENEITILKFLRLVLFNTTFYLSSDDSSNKDVFVNFALDFARYMRTIIEKHKQAQGGLIYDSGLGSGIFGFVKLKISFLLTL